MRRLALIGFVGTFAAVAFACGGDDDPTATTRPANTPVATNTVAPGQTPAPTAQPTAVPTQPPTGGGEAPSPQNPVGTISVAVFNIGPGVGIGSAQAPVESMQYWGVGEGLFAVDADGNTVNKLATGWTLDGTDSVTITLRDDVVFHQDFGPFSADDVVWTLNDSNANTNPTSIHGQAGDFAALFGEVEKIDNNTVRIPFETFDLRWDGNFLNEQAQGTTYFSKNAFDTMGESWMLENIVSTGPFEVIEWIQDDRVVLNKIDYAHWFKDAEIEVLRFVEVPEPSTRVAQVRTGQIDVASDVPLKDIKPLSDDGFVAASVTRAGRVHQVIFSGNYLEKNHFRTGEPLERSGYCVHDLPWVTCNLTTADGAPRDAGDDVEARNVRWALAKAIDRDLLVETILDGFGQPASLEYVDTTAAYFQDRWSIPYDPQGAIADMQTTAWPDGKFPINIWTGGELGGSSGTNAEINDAVAGMWQALWPDMDIQVFKSAYSIIRPSLVQRSNTIPYGGDCDEGATTIPFDWPHGLTETSLTRGGFGCGLEIPRIAETFTQVSNTVDVQERIRLNTELVDYLVEEMFFAGTVQVPTFVVYNPKSIAKWEGTPSSFTTMNEFEFIELAR